MPSELYSRGFADYMQGNDRASMTNKEYLHGWNTAKGFSDDWNQGYWDFKEFKCFKDGRSKYYADGWKTAQSEHNDWTASQPV